MSLQALGANKFSAVPSHNNDLIQLTFVFAQRLKCT